MLTAEQLITVRICELYFLPVPPPNPTRPQIGSLTKDTIQHGKQIMHLAIQFNKQCDMRLAKILMHGEVCIGQPSSHTV